MATGSTPVSGIPYPNESDSPDVAADVKLLAMFLDGKTVAGSGTLAARPTTAVLGQRYHATDTGDWFISDGTNWFALSLQSKGAMVASGQAEQIIVRTFTDTPVLGTGAIITDYHVTGQDFPTACLGAWASTAWYSDVGHTAYASAGGSWIQYFASGTQVQFNALNPTGGYLYPVSKVFAYGY